VKIHRRLLVAGIAVLLAIAVSIQPASAWNDRGHMSVGYVAYKRLNLATRNRVNALLKLNPKYNDWAAKVEQQMPNASPDDKNLMIFMLATTWADEIKRDRAYKQDGTQGGNRPDGSPDPGRNTGYDDLLMHKYWHFIDTPFSTDGTPLPPIPTPNAQERIALFRNVLASSSPDELKSYDLVWLLHIVGDIHQPLHASTRVSQPDPDGDAGGNLVKLDCAKCELHFFWDDLLGTQNDLKTVVKGARKLPKPQGALVAKTDEKDWIAESFQEAQQVVYAPPVGPGNGPYTLTIEYKKSAGKLAKQRVALAGARLAKLLNDELK
jgi:S1/P1 Nuclease